MIINKNVMTEVLCKTFKSQKKLLLKKFEESMKEDFFISNILQNSFVSNLFINTDYLNRNYSKRFRDDINEYIYIDRNYKISIKKNKDNCINFNFIKYSNIKDIENKILEMMTHTNNISKFKDENSFLEGYNNLKCRKTEKIFYGFEPNIMVITKEGKKYIDVIKKCLYPVDTLSKLYYCLGMKVYFADADFKIKNRKVLFYMIDANMQQILFGKDFKVSPRLFCESFQLFIKGD